MEQTILLLIAALIVGISKGGLASAAAVAVPMLSLFMNPIEAAALLLPVYIVTDWVAVWLYRRDFSGRNLSILIPSILCGIAVATILAPFTPESLLLLATGLIGLWYCLRTWLRQGATEHHTARVSSGIFWGVVTGITSFITHSGAPPAQAYLLPQRLPKLEFAGTMAMAFAAANLAKLPAYWELGKMHGLSWSLTLALVATGVIGTRLGRSITLALSAKAYQRIIETTLFLLSIVLLGKAGWMLFIA
ncbi:sulfite exporter TauE/SafE family protein [Salinisphaera sp. USBA-960]|uniref:sulfite exporter TauE/SafE family protein n=1 Tax=Salinisphaera orenii TaxID=856731 RepID=UPI000DBE6585|nr:sulfite exporter TauE/SafE family protein [Salifodinibacter halophilus]NNC25671.1 sulfite exporter TauE/SafE family protein [Salifodinibacter halophilus]